jgi:hypothetical protein
MWETLSRERAVEVSGFAEPASDASDPTRFPMHARRAAHGRPWFMDAMEARAGDGVAWFRMNHVIIDGRRVLIEGAAVLCAGTGGLDPRHRAAV